MMVMSWVAAVLLSVNASEDGSLVQAFTDWRHRRRAENHDRFEVWAIATLTGTPKPAAEAPTTTAKSSEEEPDDAGRYNYTLNLNSTTSPSAIM